jgi:hypothetical protein
MNTATRHPATKHAAPKPKPRTGLESWEDGIDKADEKWDAYDCEIRSAVGEYDRHLSRTPGYVPLDWRIIKAMLWVETGAKVADWRVRPMQIGKDGDPGMMALLGGREGGELIIPPSLRVGLSVSTGQATPAQNIRAGIGYLLMRMASFAFRTVPDADTRIYEVTAQANDSIEKIAKARGSTPELMKALNPSVHMLKPGEVLKYRKASVRKVITGWKSITSSSVAAYYNAGGDPLYVQKMNYALAAVRQRMAVACK